ncbi:hypothetical protein F4810DRAFT_721289 [Camillea tinctor]|nr:hypothetical protein F4810DRAFT_721289 [Camillea tinctor]
MCLFPYPVHPPKSKKGRKTKMPVNTDDIQEITRKVIDEAMDKAFSSEPSYATSPMRISCQNRRACEMDHGLEEYRYAYLTHDEWNEHKETLKKTYDMVGDNGKKMDSLRDTMCSEGEVTRDAIKETHGYIKDTQGAVCNTQDAIKVTQDAVESARKDIQNARDVITGTRDAVRDTQEKIMKNHGEQISKHADCVAEVDKVRKMLEEGARKRDEAEKRQQMMQKAQDYPQCICQAEQNANRSSRSRSRSTSGRSSESRRRHNTSKEPREPGRRRRRERESESSLVERIEKALNKTEKANQDLKKDSRPYSYELGGQPQYPGADWGDYYRSGVCHCPPSHHYFYDDFDTFGDMRGYVPPYRRPFRPGASGSVPRQTQTYGMTMGKLEFWA